MLVDTFHLDHLSELFQTNRNRKNALDMSQYMKGHFYFFGIKNPLRQKIMREWWREQSIKNEYDLKCLISSLWKLDEREFQYVAGFWETVQETFHARIHSIHSRVCYNKILVGYRGYGCQPFYRGCCLSIS